MGEKDHPLYRNPVAAGAQEIFELAGWLVELHAWRASPPVTHLAPLHRVAIAVVFGEPPLVTGAGHGRVAVLALDGKQPAGAQQEVIDLAATVTIAPHQRPLVTKDVAQPGCDQLLTLHSGREDVDLIGGAHRHRRRYRGLPPRPAGS